MSAFLLSVDKKQDHISKQRADLPTSTSLTRSNSDALSSSFQVPEDNISSLREPLLDS